jgi:hypothetical protein
MGWEQIKDYSSSFIAIVILGVPLIIEAISAKRSKGLIVLYVLCCVFLIFLGADKIKRDNIKEGIARNDKAELKSSIENLQMSISIDSAERKALYEKLEEKFNIIIDSQGNPTKIFNTKIEKARDVYIGND